MAGITDEGFDRPSVLDLLDEIQTDELNTISPLLDVSADQPLGQLNGIIADRFGILWELAETIYHAFDPDAAEGDLLENLCKLIGVVRRPASKSTVEVQCELDPGTELQAGTNFVVDENHPDRRFTPAADFTATGASTATYNVLFEAEQTGLIQVEANKLTVISTAVVGWNSATNASPASVGHDVDTDSDLRTRRQDALTRAGGSTLDAIRADLLAISQERDDAAVITVRIIENETDVTADGVPPHSFEVVIFDGTAGENVPLSNAIAQAIWDNKPVGIRSVGSSTGTAIDADGQSHTVAFTRPTARQVWVHYVLTKPTEYVGDFAAKGAIADECNRLFPPGTSVIASHVRSLPFILPLGVGDVTDFAIGFSASPTLEDNLAISLREYAQFDSGRIDL